MGKPLFAAGQLLWLLPGLALAQSAPGPAPAVGNSVLSSGPVAAAGPYAVPRQGEFAALDPNLADFKEIDYIGHQAERQRYTDPTDFTFDFPGQEGILTVGPGGQSLQVDLDNKPAIYNSDSMSQSLFTLVPCGLNVPHLHPRAGKVVHVLQGTISIGFVEENGGRAVGANVTAGQSYVIPRGLAMWIHNLGCEPASYLDTWSSNDPGILNMVEALFKMPLPTVAAALGVDTTNAQSLMNQKLPKIAIGPEECIAACNTTSSATSPSAASPSASSVSTSGNSSPANAGLLGPQPAAQFSTLTAGPG